MKAFRERPDEAFADKFRIAWHFMPNPATLWQHLARPFQAPLFLSAFMLFLSQGGLEAVRRSPRSAFRGKRP
jgi:hypothetical protein